MDLVRINANHLVALDLLLREASVSRAAERQGVSASAMSHTLRALREMFDDPLLVRVGSQMALTPFAERLRDPLRRALGELEHTLSGGFAFDPARSTRSFVILAPDFLSTLFLPPLAELLAREAPGIDIEIRPVERYGNALRLRQVAALAEGEAHLTLAAVIDEVPGLRSEVLYDERFACLVRRDHPRVGETLDLETYAALPHVLTTITDERTPSWIDRALADRGLERHVAIRTRYFMSVPLLVADSDLVATCPLQLARYFAARVPVRVLEPPLALPTYQESMAWHVRYDADPGLRWLRAAVRRATEDVLRASG